MVHDDDLPFAFLPMEARDIQAVMDIEHASFPTPWTASAYRYELERNELAHYFVLARRPAPELAEGRSNGGGLRERLSRWLFGSESNGREILGYSGYWLMAGEAHISTIAIDPRWRGKGLGEYLLLRIIGRAIADGASLVTLEVRVSNEPAQGLYEKYAFEVVGRRKRYYHDNNEDALIMTVEDVQSPAYAEFLVERRAQLLQRLAAGETT
ncbi:MAG TPA: ribosomal protein S18-alanine N-acetyltransferase [Ardenticatenaceae bacterium]|nr:ribosomal protein S18-alanine N-acetyltransferase [Ardenticatenaceae bacterium]